VLVAINASGQSVTLSQLPNAASGLPVPGVPVAALVGLVGGTPTLGLSSCSAGTCLNGTLAPWSVQVLSP
jgi:hypothetical protein